MKRPDDQRDRYLSAEEIASLKAVLDEKMYRKEHRAINQTFYRLRLIVLIALTTGMRVAEIFALKWKDVQYREELIAVRAKLKRGRMRYVPMPPELATEIQRFPVVMGEDRIFRRNGERASVSEWKGVSRRSWTWPAFGISVFTTCATRSRPGT